MKKTRINLVVNREDYRKFEEYFEYLKIALIIIAGIFFVLFVIFFINIKNRTDRLQVLVLKKETLLRILKEKATDQAKINYIESKYNDLNTFLKDDAYSSPYYSLLNTALSESSEAANLKSFSIDKDRSVSFTIVFSDFVSLRNFFKFVESESFLSNFEEISLKSFSVIGATDIQKENYELSFTGKFIPLKQNLF